MGLKSEPRQSNRAPKSLPGGKYKQEQIMKQVVETTRCTHTEAEEALIECNYDLELAVNYIIDRNGDNVWTEQKNRKAKKSETEEPTRPERAEKSDRRFNRNRTEDSDKKTFRRERNDDPEKKFVKKERTEDGEKKFVRHERTENSDRKYTNRNGNENEESSRPSGMRGGRRGGRGFYSNRERDGQGHSGENRFDKSEKKYVNHNEHNTVENREDFPAPSVVPKEIHNKAGPLSYAALVAKGNQKPPQPPIPAVATTAPATSGLHKDDSPAPEPKPIVSSSEDTQSSNNTEQKDIESATQSLTSQLKNDLGLSSHAASTATQNSPLISAASSSMKGGDKGQIAVEHAGADSVSSSGYQFGPADGQQVPQAPQQQSQLSQSIKPEEPTYVPQNNVAASDFNRAHDNGLYKPQDPIVSKPTPMVPNPQMHPMSAYGVDNSQVLMQPAMSMPRRNLGYAETNSVTIQPERPQQQQPPQQVIREAPVTTTPSYQNYNKAPVTAAASMGHPQLGVHHQQNQHQQQQMYNPMYNNFPYVNLYSPVAGRDDQTAYANPYMPYQFGMDMNSLPHVIPHLPLQHQLGHQQHHQPQGGLSHQTQSGHRNDHIQSGYSDKMQSYGQSSATSNNSVGQNGQRENSNVPPPPGFSGPPGNMEAWIIMVDTGLLSANSGDGDVTKMLKTFYRLIIAKPDKSSFITDPTFSTTLVKCIEDDRPQVMQYMARILLSLTDNNKNAKLVAALPNFEILVGKAVEKPFPPKIVHSLLVVQSRLSAANAQPKLPDFNPVATSSPGKSFIKTAGTKQLVYEVLDNTEEKQSTLQERSMPIKGVVSVWFAGTGSKIKCIYRVQDSFSPKILERCIFNCGYERLQRVVRLDDGTTQPIDLFRDEVFALTPEEEEEKKKALPQYLDDNILVFDPNQCIVPNNHVSQSGGTWLSSVKSYLPFW